MNGNLTEFSAEVKAQFNELFTSLLNLEHKIIENEENAFCIEIQAPSLKAERPLIIDTYNEEITVAFDAYHAHFEEFINESCCNNAFEFISNIIGGQFAVVSYWREEQWCGSMLLKEESLPKNNENYPYADRIKIRSWFGNWDQDLECTSRG